MEGFSHSFYLVTPESLSSFYTLIHPTCLVESLTICTCANPSCLAVYQVATEADIGLADAYINGYISFVDNREGFLTLLPVKSTFCSIH